MKDIPISPRIEKMKRERRKRRLRLSILLSILFLSIVGALSYFSAHSRVTINNIVIIGNSIIEESDLRTDIQNKISGRYIGLFSRSNFLIYPHNKIYNSLLLDFPRIESLNVKLDGVHTIRVDIKERAGSYLYCGVSVPEEKAEIGENCYFINNDGYIFDKAPYFSGDVYFKYYMNIDGDPLNPTKVQMVSADRFHELVRFVDGVTSLGFKPSYLVVSSDGINSLYLKPSNEISEPKILFKEDSDLPTILENLSLAMKESEFANEINSKYSTLSYIDLRFKNKVLYKFE